MPKKPKRDYYTAQQMADILGVSPSTIYRWMDEGELQAYKLGSLWRVKKNTFDSYLKERGLK